MGDHPVGADGVPADDAEREFAHGAHLYRRERPVAPLVAGIDDLDADRHVVEPSPALPIRHARMPRPTVFGDQAVDGTVLLADIVRADPRRGVAGPVDRLPAGAHPGLVPYQRVDRPEERRLRKKRVTRCRLWWWPYPPKHNKK